MRSRPFALLLSAVSLAAAVTTVVLAGGRADAQQRTHGPQWQYGILTLSQSQPVFALARKQITVSAPLATATEGQTGGGQTLNQFGLATEGRVNLDVGALDVFGADGWEAYAAFPSDGKTIVLMRRPL